MGEFLLLVRMDSKMNILRCRFVVDKSELNAMSNQGEAIPQDISSFDYQPLIRLRHNEYHQEFH